MSYETRISGSNLITDHNDNASQINAINLWDTLSQALSWQDEAACLGMDVEDWFSNNAARCKHALSVCEQCKVRKQCLNYAVSIEQNYELKRHGIFGGKTARQRSKRRR